MICEDRLTKWRLTIVLYTLVITKRASKKFLTKWVLIIYKTNINQYALNLANPDSSSESCSSVSQVILRPIVFSQAPNFYLDKFSNAGLIETLEYSIFSTLLKTHVENKAKKCFETTFTLPFEGI